MLVLLLAAFPSAQAAPARQDDVDAHIANAESAAPTVVARAATIMGWDEEGMPTVVLRAGTNGWTCYADWTASPGNDPVCYDSVFEAWNQALLAGKEPEVSGPGIAYMLHGGSDPSNTDPTASGPAAGEDWITTPPHVMVMAPGGLDASYFATDHASGYPYIMYAGTDYEHLMIPVADMPEMDMSE